MDAVEEHSNHWLALRPGGPKFPPREAAASPVVPVPPLLSRPRRGTVIVSRCAQVERQIFALHVPHCHSVRFSRKFTVFLCNPSLDHMNGASRSRETRRHATR
jgi:hypothetical protein